MLQPSELPTAGRPSLLPQICEILQPRSPPLQAELCQCPEPSAPRLAMHFTSLARKCFPHTNLTRACSGSESILQPVLQVRAQLACLSGPSRQQGLSAPPRLLALMSSHPFRKFQWKRTYHILSSSWAQRVPLSCLTSCIFIKEGVDDPQW